MQRLIAISLLASVGVLAPFVSIADTTAPSISGITIATLKDAGAAIVWDTNEVSSSLVEYGLNATLGSESYVDATYDTYHAIAVSNITPNTTIYYRVVSSDAAGNIQYSGINKFTTTGSYASGDITNPTVPLNVSTSILSTTSLVLKWDPSFDANGIAGYLVEQCVGSGCSSFANIAAPVDRFVTLANLEPNTTYRYRVRAMDVAGNLSPISAEHTTATPSTVTPDTTPPEISGISVSNITVNTATVAWLTNEEADSQVAYGTSPSLGTQTTADLLRTTSRIVTLRNLAANTTYYYVVRSRDAAGNLRVSSLALFTTLPAPVTADTTPPTAPVNLSGVAISSSQINLSWSASTDTVGVTGYRVESCTGASCTNFAQVGSPTVTTLSVTGLSSNTIYRFRIRALDAAGNLSAYSTELSVTTPTATSGNTIDTAPPTAPANVSAVAVSSSQVNLSWSPSVDSVGVTGYRVESCTGVSCVQFVHIASPTGTTYSITNLAANTIYRFRIRALDAAGNLSAYSTEMNVTTPANPTTGTGTVVDTTAPQITVVQPVPNNTVSGNVVIIASAADNIGIAGVQLYVDGLLLGSELTTLPYLINWNTPLVQNGLHTLTARARDTVGNTTMSAPIVVTVSNGGVALGNTANTTSTTGTTQTGTITALQPGAVGESVVTVKYALQTLGYLTPATTPTNVYDAAMVDAIKRFQTAKGILPVDGVLNTTTLQALLNALSIARLEQLSATASTNTETEPEIIYIETDSGELFTEPFKRGDTHPQITLLQQLLVRDGVYSEALISGYYGPRTEDAVKRFQVKYGIARAGDAGYGTVGPATRAKLNELSTVLSVKPRVTGYGTMRTTTTTRTTTTGSGNINIFTIDQMLGSKHAQTSLLQQVLRNDGVYAGGLMTGYYGSQTLAAVQKFQVKYGITKAGQAGYGRVGPATRAKLNAIAAPMNLAPMGVSGQFAIGQTVVVKNRVNVRSLPKITSATLGVQSVGATGVIVDGSRVSDGYVWWHVRYANGRTGWSIEQSLAKSSGVSAAKPVTQATTNNTTGVKTAATKSTSGTASVLVSETTTTVTTGETTVVESGGGM